MNVCANLSLPAGAEVASRYVQQVRTVVQGCHTMDVCYVAGVLFLFAKDDLKQHIALKVERNPSFYCINYE